uniref:hypothetical protein n=1 Tax=Escherichia coli TaxID=562 RepID=UPI003D9B64B4
MFREQNALCGGGIKPQAVLVSCASAPGTLSPRYKCETTSTLKDNEYENRIPASTTNQQKAS